jgi:hypothetical protein
MTLRLNGSTSGYVEIDAPATAGSNTLVLPTGNGTSGQVLSTNGSGALSFVDRMTAAGPAFSARRSGSSQVISASTWTKVQLINEDFDTASCFDSSTNYRFTPNVAGYYQINATVEFNNLSASYMVAIYKNGASWQNAQYNNSTSTGSCGAVGALIYLNGSTDYVELYGFTNSASSGFYDKSHLSGFLARPA